MKPLKLVMSAFGSYSGVVEIDFTRTNQGIFLITGDTGAGKTTIFDAIVYALYDRTSAGAREPADMRSQYADADTPTYVEYTFYYECSDDEKGREVYTIRRNPRYTRISKRKDKDGNRKEAVEQPAVELILPDGTVFGGKVRETNEKIVDIVGLDADQFTQIAMLAQGEFMKLLQAPSNKRKEIFGRIFNTNIYYKVQERLRNEAKKRYIALEDNRKFCERELDTIKGNTDTDLSFTDYNYEELLKKAAQLVKAGQQLEETNKIRLKQVQSQLDALKMELAAGEQINSLYDSLEQVKSQREALDKQSGEIKELSERLTNAKKAEKVAASANKCAGQRKAIAESSKRITDYEKELRTLSAALTQLEASKVTLQEARADNEPRLQGELARLKEELPLYEQADKLQGELLDVQKKLQQQADKNTAKGQEVEKQQQRLVVLHRTVTDKLNTYQQLNDAFIAEQAGIMARELRENEPCPVCGSTLHPKKAELSDKEVSQTQVNHAKAEWQSAEAQEAACTDSLNTAQTELERLRSEYAEKNTSYETMKARHASLKERLRFTAKSDVDAQIKKLNRELSDFIKKADKAAADWQLAKEKMTQMSGMLTSEQQQQLRLTEELRTLETELEFTLKAQGFADMAAYEGAVMASHEMEQAERRITEYKEALVRSSASIRQLEKQLSDRKRTDLTEIRQKLNDFNAAYTELDANVKELYADNQRNQEAYDMLKKLYDKRVILKREYELYSTLDKTANGNLAGVAKLDLQTYIQRRYFEAIIHEANKRLIKMSANQFILQCRSLDKLGSQGAVGLDLDVYSLVNDKTRDVKTLSGGESFMAALSMALGMADVMQNTAGKVRLDTMFVDEGFGSLDEESRGEAIKILQELAGDRHLVGIISHVTELREQIDRKLIVKKDENGSRVEWSTQFC